MGRRDGKAVFVPGMLPGETAEIKITRTKKDYDEAEIVRLLEPSPKRVEPPCPHAAVCGGCSLMIAENTFQRELRAGILMDALKKSKCGYEEKIQVLPSTPFEYRSRFQFHRTRGGSPGLCGRASRTVVPIRDCPVAVPEIREMLANGELKEKTAAFPEDARIHVFAYHGKKAVESPSESENAFTIELCGKTLSFDIRSFFQSNIPVFEKTAAKALSGFHFKRGGARAETSFLDLYSGCGVFSVVAGDRFHTRFLVEENGLSVAYAKRNLADSSPRSGEGASAEKRAALFFNMKDDRWIRTQEAAGEFDAAIIDPPRTGIGKRTLEWLASARIENLRYLSCDPSTFARDAAFLISKGWVLQNVFLCDFYPQTHHVETLGFFSR